MRKNNHFNTLLLKKQAINSTKTIDFYEFGRMIRSLIIGNEKDVEHYSQLIAASKYFGTFDTRIITNENVLPDKQLVNAYDAIFFVSSNKKLSPVFMESIRCKQNIYFVDQPDFDQKTFSDLYQLYLESGCLLFPEIIEIHHPLVQEFISTNGSHLLFRYNKSIASKKQIRPVVLSALCFLSVLSPMQVKKLNINTLGTTHSGKPIIKVRLKMFDSSVAYFILKLENQADHNIMIEKKNGCFTFNFTGNYLENIHGKRFLSDPISLEQMQLRTIEKFALHIILATSPKFSFEHYYLSIKPLEKIENILKNSF